MMNSDEEEIHSPADAVELLRSNSDNHKRKSSNCFKLYQTICLCFAFLGLGLVIAIPGPTLPVLQDQTHSNISEISYIFLGRSIGYLAGSVIGGVLFDSVNHHSLLFSGLLLTGIGTYSVPHFSALIPIVVAFSTTGATMGLLDTGGNVACIELWGSKNAPYMQALHFSFGLGAFISPLVATPFLSDPHLYHSNFSSTNNCFNESSPIDNCSDNVHSLAQTGLIGPLLSQNNKIKDIWPSVTKPKSQQKRGIKSILSENHFLFMANNSDDNVATYDNSSTTESTPGSVITKPKKLMSSGKDADGSKMASDLKNSNRRQKLQKDIKINKVDTTRQTFSSSVVNNSSDFPTSNSEVVSIVEIESTIPSTTVESTSMIQESINTTIITQQKFSLHSAVPFEISTVAPNKETITNLDHLVNDKNNGDYLQSNQTKLNIFSNMSRVEYIFTILAAFLLFASTLFFCLCCTTSSRKQGVCLKKKHAETEQEGPSSIKNGRVKRSVKKAAQIKILVLLFLFFFLYVGMEVTFGNFIATFAINQFGWKRKDGSFLTSVFWGSFALCRGLAVPVSKCLSAPVIIVIDLIFTVVSLGIILLAVNQEPLSMWILCGFVGAGMASIFPSGVTWAERYLKVTGKTASLFVVGSALGEMVIPVITGFLIGNYSPMYLIYTLFTLSILASIIYIIMQNLASNKSSGGQWSHIRPSSDSDRLEMRPVNSTAQVENKKDRYGRKIKLKKSSILRHSIKNRNDYIEASNVDDDEMEQLPVLLNRSINRVHSEENGAILPIATQKNSSTRIKSTYHQMNTENEESNVIGYASITSGDSELDNDFEIESKITDNSGSQITRRKTINSNTQYNLLVDSNDDEEEDLFVAIASRRKK